MYVMNREDVATAAVPTSGILFVLSISAARGAISFSAKRATTWRNCVVSAVMPRRAPRHRRRGNRAERSEAKRSQAKPSEAS